MKGATMSEVNKYSEYFTIDENYFPQINDSSIRTGERNDPDFWMRTYPHKTFIKMLKDLEHILSRTKKGSLWIEGAYGSGKSQCAYALRRILEAPEEKLHDYWSKYDVLNEKHGDLLSKLCGHKSRQKTVVAYRYSSSEIGDNKDLYFAIQESVKKALEDAGIEYLGEATLKNSIIAWLENEINKEYFDQLLSRKYSLTFAQSSANEIITALKRQGEVSELVRNILRVARKEGIIAFDLTVESLCSWLVDVIEKNNIRLVFIWDEFSEYFNKNKGSLTGFQKLVELVDQTPFYFIIVTHQIMAMINLLGQEGKKLRDRFVEVEIELPDNVAFELIGDALKVRSTARKVWDAKADDLNDRLYNSRKEVANAAKITDSKTIKKIMPIHPMAALVLKHISESFASNQRSMFDFVKTTGDDDVQAFQWFVKTHGPDDEFPLLTINMLWNFFYEKGRNNLPLKIQGILDSYEKKQRDLYEKKQGNLQESEKIVLKTILIMQALDAHKFGDVKLFQATEKNLALAFEGIRAYEGSAAVNIAKSLERKGVVLRKRVDKETEVFAVELSSVDSNKLEELKGKVLKEATTERLIGDGEIDAALALPISLSLRFESDPNSGRVTTVGKDNFIKTLNKIRGQSPSWKFDVLMVCAKDSAEASDCRRRIQDEAIKPENAEVVFIDATALVLDDDQFKEYVEYSATAVFYQGNDNDASREYVSKAKGILNVWNNSFEKGNFKVWFNGKETQIKTRQGLHNYLQELVKNKYPFAFEFRPNLVGNHLKLTQAFKSVLCGIRRKTEGVIVRLEEKLFPSDVWESSSEYWKEQPDLDISIIKIELDSFIKAEFDKTGQVSINAIWDLLEEKYGFARCNLYAFLVGFLLREYGLESSGLRYADTLGAQEPITPDILAEAVGNYITGKSDKETRIVMQTEEERAFYNLAVEAWNAPSNCSSPAQAANAVSALLNKREFPLQWLEGIISDDLYKVALMFVELNKLRGDQQLNAAREIGKIAMVRPTLGADLKQALVKDAFLAGANAYLQRFDNGKLWELAGKIRVQENILADVSKRFKIEYQSLWDVETQNDEIRKLEVEYAFIFETNKILNVDAASLRKALENLKETIRWSQFSYETLKARTNVPEEFFDFLLKICNGEEILPEILEEMLPVMRKNNNEIRELFNAGTELFKEVYAPYLQDFDDEAIEVIRNNSTGMFEKSSRECNRLVEQAARSVEDKKLKKRLADLWKQKTDGSSSPSEWSNRSQTPILCLVDDSEFDKAKRVFEIVNRIDSSNKDDLQHAIDYLQESNVFDRMNDSAVCREAFKRRIFKTPSAMKLLTYEDVLEELKDSGISAYNWYPNPEIERRIERLVEKRYDQKGRTRVLAIIDKMDGAKLKEYLKRLIRDNSTVGLEILATEDD